MSYGSLDGRTIWGRMDTCICMAWSLHCPPEAIITLFHNRLSFSSVSQSCPTLWSHGLQHSKLPCPSPAPGACSNSCPLSRWCYLTTLSSAAPFSSCPQSFTASGSFPMSRLFVSSVQSIGASASIWVLPMNIHGLFPIGLTGLISLLSKGLRRASSSTTVWKYQFFGTQPSWWSNSHILKWLQEKS